MVTKRTIRVIADNGMELKVTAFYYDPEYVYDFETGKHKTIVHADYYHNAKRYASLQNLKAGKCEF